MYLKPETTVSDWSAVEAFLAEHPLGLLTTAIPLVGQPTMQASHVPFLYLPPASPPPTLTGSGSSGVCGTWSSTASGGEEIDLGRLRCHLARSNPQAKALLSRSPSTEDEALIVFASPLNHAGYISPRWYTTTKPATAKTVPTWNYAELHVYGHIAPTSPATLSQIVRDLSDAQERRYADTVGRDEVWSVDDAPPKYVELLQRAIVGLEVKVTRVGLKMKMSREKPEGDRQGVMAGLREVGGDAARVADLVERLGPMKKASS